MSETTTFVPVADQTVVEAYRAADQSGKGKIRAQVQKEMQAAMGAMEAEKAFNLNATLAALTTAKPAKVEVDPRLVIAQRVEDLLMAAHLLQTGAVVPTDLAFVPEDADFTDGFLNLPTVEADGDNAHKIAGQKITRTNLKRSIQGVIDRAFEGTEEGTFLTIAQIRTRGSLEDYVPSDGAIAARLWPTDKHGNATDCTLDGVEPTEAVVGQHPRGATSL